jgi:hypothetical protein
VTGGRVVGEPAARLVAEAIAEAVALDEHRRRLAAGNPALADLLVDFEEEAFRQMSRQVQGGLAATEAAAWLKPPPYVPGFRDRVRHGLNRIASRHTQQPRHRRVRTEKAVQGDVTPDDAGGEKAGTESDPEDPKEPS